MSLDLSVPPGATPDEMIRVSVDPEPGTTVPPELFGVNTLFFHDTDSVRAHPGYRASLAQLAPTVMRFPAGTAGDNYLWKTGTLHRQDWFPGRSDPDGDANTTEFLQLASDFRAMPLTVINYRTFPDCGDMEACYRNTEEWVAFVNGEKKAGVRHWEFGNEVYFRTHGVNPEHYAASYNTMRRRLRKIDPELRLGLTMASYWNAGPAVVEEFNMRVVTKLDAPPDFIILHFYPEVTAENLARDGMGMRTKIRFFRQRLKEHGLPPDLPIFVTEWNASGKSDILRGQTVGHLLCVAQGLLELSDSNVQCASFWPLHNSDKALLQRDTHNLLPAGRMFSWMREAMAGSTRLPVRVEQKPRELETAAFRSPDGRSVRVVVLNRSGEREHRMELSLGGIPDSSSATLTTLLPAGAADGKSPDLNSLDLELNRQSLPLRGGRAALRLPPLTFSVLEVSSTSSSSSLSPQGR